MSDSDAYQATTTATKIPLPAQGRILFLRNDGPNDIFVSATQAKCTTAKGRKVPANGGTLDLFPINTDEVWVIAATASQVSPADTRWYVFGVY